MKTVLITGGAGYVGSVLIPKLLPLYCVRVYDKLLFGDFPLRKYKNKINLIIGDIRNIAPSVLTDVYAVIHLAGLSTDPTAQFNPRETDLINHLATERLARLCKIFNIKRFLFASTCSVYFDFNNALNPPLRQETDTVNPVSCYAVTKRCAEQSLLELADSHFQPIIFRQGTIYGYSPRMRYDLVFNSFVRDGYCKKSLRLDGGGNVWRPFIDIQDVVNIYAQALAMPLKRIGGQIFNMVDTNLRIIDLAKEVQRFIRKKTQETLGLQITPAVATRNYKADPASFKRTFKFKPQRTLYEAFTEIWNLIQHMDMTDLYSPIYHNDLWFR